ncbi:unnamed protein product [Paramecium sonneborni]|uniref:Helicase C-terminal domain-containing protein n=1 Tax=Paramecium sonneborni TaxID=65129 RepID=A0A8S1LL29_9CILI|nr:unnamed protein product [Paramecium sonneborni]
MSVDKRKKVIKQFKESTDAIALLLSLRSTSTGLNLTMANNVFLVDPWWNLAIEDQAIGRADRIGQQNKIKVVRFLCRNTIEQSINLLHQKKKFQIKKLQVAKLKKHKIYKTSNLFYFSNNNEFDHHLIFNNYVNLFVKYLMYQSFFDLIIQLIKQTIIVFQYQQLLKQVIQQTLFSYHKKLFSIYQTSISQPSIKFSNQNKYYLLKQLVFNLYFQSFELVLQRVKELEHLKVWLICQSLIPNTIMNNRSKMLIFTNKSINIYTFYLYSNSQNKWNNDISQNLFIQIIQFLDRSFLNFKENRKQNSNIVDLILQQCNNNSNQFSSQIIQGTDCRINLSQQRYNSKQKLENYEQQ